ncbi:MAG: VapC toxin family PIN domain ribonuclease [Proteobacteria bacterium]|nr:VapC toxin family PIN domain ribonuclease [Pseudomonadota bacterium]MDA1298969.1 VapC toxin family PIN domain ribonuclease [Pseudomonadota bacterium]
MHALLDVNVLIALLDQNHIAHDAAWRWMESNIEMGWATCPITQNGCLRIMSQPGYPNHHTTREIAARLRQAMDQPFHQFWADDSSILSRDTVNWDLLIGPRQLTAIYLLSLAVQNNGRFVTFDTKVSMDMVHGASSRHLVRL